MTVKELIERLGKEPLDAEVLTGGMENVYRRVYATRFTWAKQVGTTFEPRNGKVDNQTKTAVVIWS